MSRCQPINYLDLINSNCFKKFSEKWYNLLINRENPEVIMGCSDLFHPSYKDIVINFKNHIFNEIKFKKSPKLNVSYDKFGHLLSNCRSSIIKYANNKKCLVINNFADLIVKHYNSGKVTDFYKLIKSKGLIDVVPNFELYSFITEYPLLNGKILKKIIFLNC